MTTEYAVMKQVDGGEPLKAYNDTFDTFKQAEKTMIDLEHSASGGYDGYNVHSAADARRVAALLEAAEKTHYYIARREVGPWEEYDGF